MRLDFSPLCLFGNICMQNYQTKFGMYRPSPEDRRLSIPSVKELTKALRKHSNLEDAVTEAQELRLTRIIGAILPGQEVSGDVAWGQPQLEDAFLLQKELNKSDRTLQIGRAHV